MRFDKDFLVFATHHDWYTVEEGKGYVPTEAAPDEAKEAMKRVNEYLKRESEKNGW